MKQSYFGTLGPPIGANQCNGALYIHEDNSEQVKSKYEEPRCLNFMSIDGPIGDNVQPNYEKISPGGRSEDYLAYAGTSNQCLSLVLSFVASVDRGDQGEYPMVERQVRWLKSLCYPTVFDNVLLPPAICQLVIGRFISRRVQVSAFNVRYDQPYGGIDNPTDYPMVAQVSLDLVSVNRVPMEASDFIPVSGAALFGI